VSTAKLHEATGWSSRRFNPAVRELLKHVSDAHVSKTVTSDYPTSSFLLDRRETFALKQFCAEKD
jgi:hypothetical protein